MTEQVVRAQKIEIDRLHKFIDELYDIMLNFKTKPFLKKVGTAIKLVNFIIASIETLKKQKAVQPEDLPKPDIIEDMEALLQKFEKPRLKNVL